MSIAPRIELEVVAAPRARDLEQHITEKVWLGQCARSENSQRKYKHARTRFLTASGCESVALACRDRETGIRSLNRFHKAIEHLAPASQQQEISAIRSLLVLLEADGVIAEKVSHHLKRVVTVCKCSVCKGKGCPECDDTGKQGRPKPQFPEGVPDHQKCLAAINSEKNPAHRLLLRVLYYSGARSSEVLGLKVADLHDGVDAFGNPAKIGYVVGKGNVVRSLVFTGKMLAALDFWLATRPDAVYVFPWRSGQTLYGICERAWKRVGVTAETMPMRCGYGAHSWRHCSSTNAQNFGATAKQMSDALGHRNEETVKRYSHMGPVAPGAFIPW